MAIISESDLTAGGPFTTPNAAGRKRAAIAVVETNCSNAQKQSLPLIKPKVVFGSDVILD